MWKETLEIHVDYFFFFINWVYISYFSASCSVIALSCSGYILAKWTQSLLMTQLAFYIEISLIHHWDSFSLYMNCFFLKHRWDYSTDNHPEQSSLKMLYCYYIIIVILQNSNNPINLIKMSTDIWSYFLAMKCKAVYAVLMSPLNAEVVKLVLPLCLLQNFFQKSLFSIPSPWIPGCLI